MIKDNRRFSPLGFFFLGLIFTSLSIILLIIPESSLYFIPISRESISGIILILLSIGIFVFPGAGVFFAILVIFRFKAPLLAFFEIAINLAIPVVVLSFDMY